MLNTSAAGITVKTTHDNNGTAKNVAKGFGKQRTVAYDHALSHDRNHGLAAGTLALALGIGWDDSIVVVRNGGSTKFVFPG